MRSELEQGLLTGRLECPNSKCRAKLGQYAWQGMRCSCGVWVCPSVSLQKGRVDEVLSKVEPGKIDRGEAVATGIRLPPTMNGYEKM